MTCVWGQPTKKHRKGKAKVDEICLEKIKVKRQGRTRCSPCTGLDVYHRASFYSFNSVSSSGLMQACKFLKTTPVYSKA